jgi:uncharacterized membrane protein
MKLLYTTVIAFVMACLMVYLAVLFSWSYQSAGIDHYVALVVGSPFVLTAHFYSELTAPAMVLAFLIYFVVAFLLVVGCSKLVRRLRRTGDVEPS